MTCFPCGLAVFDYPKGIRQKTELTKYSLWAIDVHCSELTIEVKALKRIQPAWPFSKVCSVHDFKSSHRATKLKWN